MGLGVPSGRTAVNYSGPSLQLDGIGAWMFELDITNEVPEPRR